MKAIGLVDSKALLQALPGVVWLGCTSAQTLPLAESLNDLASFGGTGTGGSVRGLH